MTGAQIYFTLNLNIKREETRGTRHQSHTSGTAYPTRYQLPPFSQQPMRLTYAPISMPMGVIHPPPMMAMRQPMATPMGPPPTMATPMGPPQTMATPPCDHPPRCLHPWGPLTMPMVIPVPVTSGPPIQQLGMQGQPPPPYTVTVSGPGQESITPDIRGI